MSAVQEYIAANLRLQKLMDGRKCFGDFHGMWDFLLTYGCHYQPHPKPDNIGWGQLRMCFRNASLLALDQPELCYCEGMAWCGTFPVYHAWCVNLDRQVMDNTWRPHVVDPLFGARPDQGHWVYYGVPIKLSYLLNSLKRTQVYGVLEDYRNDYPILTEDPKLWFDTRYTLNANHRTSDVSGPAH